jgi:hypothetical protein
MKVEQKLWRPANGWKRVSNNDLQLSATVVFAFGSTKALSDQNRYHELQQLYPNAHILTCTTAGEILGSKVLDDTIVATAIRFDRTTVRVESCDISDMRDSYHKGYQLATALNEADLTHLFVLSDGQKVNGSELVKGLNNALHKEITITGGLAGDGNLFRRTLIGANAAPSEGQIAVVGFYGSNLRVGHGSRGGWEPFGPERTITRSAGNILYELDHKSALQLYREYLGPLANELPGSALLFPLAMRAANGEAIVRTVLSVNEQDQSMLFAGDMPLGSIVQLMKTNFDRLIDGAMHAADDSLATLGSFNPDFAILVSCVGRRLALNHRSEEEIEETTRILGNTTAVSGFYSYGEISPLVKSTASELHNQTMTITVYREE